MLLHFFYLLRKRICDRVVRESEPYRILFFVIFLVNISCKNKHIVNSNNKKPSFVAVKISVNIPLLDSNERIAYDNMEDYFYSYKGFSIFTRKTSLLESVGVENSVQIYKENGQRVNYIVRPGTKQIGYLFDSLGAQTYRELVSIDSFFETSIKWNYSLMHHLRDSAGADIQIGEFNKYSDKIYQLTYASTHKLGKEDIDTTHYYFSRELNHIPFSFIPQLDSQYKMKLFRVDLINNPGKNNRLNRMLPRRTLTFLLEEIKADEEDRIKELCDRVEKLSG